VDDAMLTAHAAFASTDARTRRPPGSRASAGTSQPVAVAAPNARAAQAGAYLAADGGNAVDAALAAVLVACVSEPGVVSLGGGAFVTVAPVGVEPVTVDGTVSMPGAGQPPEAFGNGLHPVFLRYGGGMETSVGHGSVATPGALVAFEETHRRYGRLPWRDVVAPAAHRARAGFPVGAAAGEYLEHAREQVFDRDPSAHAALRTPDGRPLRTGETMRMPELADFLDRVAVEGSAALHTGDVAAALADDMAANGGLLSLADLAGYRAQVRPALTVPLRDWRLSTNPAPAVGGSVLAAMLLLLDAYDAEASAADHIDAVVEVQRAVLAHRVRHLDLAPDRAAAVEALLAEIAEAGPAWTRVSPSTVNVSVVDGDGTACTVTASAGYGAGVSAPGTGVWLNNCLGERELNRAGTHALSPGERLVSNMAPSVARRADGAVLAIGSPGADRITTAILQSMWPLACENAPLQDAIDRPRLHVTCDDDGAPRMVEYEEDLPRPDGVAADLPWRGHPAHSMFFGGVAAALLEPDGRLEAAADPRREGAVVVTSATT
jgi:gamma-glutamyltranspeptidase/glutathione hydrolase